MCPRAAALGAYERFPLRVPNEKGVATARIELRVPAGVRVTSSAEVPRWSLRMLTDSAKRIVGAVRTGVHHSPITRGSVLAASVAPPYDRPEFHGNGCARRQGR